MLKKVVCFLSIAFAIALVAKSVIFILAIMGGAKLDAECIAQLVELGISWLVVLVGAVAFVFKLFEAPKTIRVPNDYLRSLGFTVEEGIFGAEMKVRLLNDGPVTILLDSGQL